MTDEDCIYVRQILDLARRRRVSFRPLSTMVNCCPGSTSTAYTAKETGEVRSDQTGSSRTVTPRWSTVLEGNSAFSRQASSVASYVKAGLPTSQLACPIQVAFMPFAPCWKVGGTTWTGRSLGSSGTGFAFGLPLTSPLKNSEKLVRSDRFR